MTIDIQHETAMTLEQASRTLPRMRSTKIHASTLWRWCKQGVNGIFLEHGRVGRTLVTTPEALNRFFVALAEYQQQPPASKVIRHHRLLARTPQRRQREMELAHQILIKAGILKPDAEQSR